MPRKTPARHFKKFCRAAIHISTLPLPPLRGHPLQTGLLSALILGTAWVATMFSAATVAAAPMPISLTLITSTIPAGDSRSLTELTTKLEDLQATVHMVKCDSKELEKISLDFQRSYRLQDLLRHITLEYKQPGKLRISGSNKVLGKAAIIMNGSLRSYRGPLAPAKVEDLKGSPGKRQSLLEYGGLLSPETLSFMQGKFVREEMLDGQMVPIFDMTYKGVTGGSYYRVWFDPKIHITLKREWYDFDGKLKATFYYQEPKEVAEGVWLPKQVEVRNAEGISAAITSIDLDSVKINQGLSDDLFAIAHL